MFFGRHSHTIDDKNRVRIPKEYRNQLGANILIGQGVNKCLYIYSAEVFEKKNAQFYGVDPFDVKKQYAMGEFISSYSNPEIDSQGRIILPKDLKNYAGITKNIVTRGVLDRIEIWSEEELAKKDASAGSEFVEMLADKG